MSIPIPITLRAPKRHGVVSALPKRLGLLLRMAGLTVLATQALS